MKKFLSIFLLLFLLVLAVPITLKITQSRIDPRQRASEIDTNFGKAAYFNGTGYLQALTSDITPPFEIDMRIFPQAGSIITPHLFSSKRDPTCSFQDPFYISLYQPPDTNDFGINLNFMTTKDGGRSLRSKNAFPYGSWYSLQIMVTEKNEVKLFVNGIEEASGTYNSSICSIKNGFFIGASTTNENFQNPHLYKYNGGLDELRISNSNRPTEVSSSPFESDSNTLGVWRFEDNLNNFSNQGITLTAPIPISYVASVETITNVSPTPTPIPANSPPTLQSVSPSESGISSVIKLEGYGFKNNSKGTVRFFKLDGKAFPDSSGINGWNNTTIYASVSFLLPPNTPMKVAVVRADGTMSNKLDFKTLGSQPIIESVTPQSIPPGGEITLSGSNFGTTKGTIEIHYPLEKPQVIALSVIKSWTDTEIRMLLPTNIADGEDIGIYLTTSQHSVASLKIYTLGLGLPNPLPSNDIGITNPGFISITVPKFSEDFIQIPVFKLKSAGAESFYFVDYMPTNANNGITFTPTSGGLHPTTPVDVSLRIEKNVPPGIYTGYGRLIGNTTYTEIIIPATVTILGSSATPTSIVTKSPLQTIVTIPPTIPATVTSLPTGTTATSLCSEKIRGDANCDGIIDLLDINIWRNEFLSGSLKTSDFNIDNKIDLLDFNIWKNNFSQ